ncbi:MAG: hypothetical protein V4764_03570 [Burkholderia sp.]
MPSGIFGRDRDWFGAHDIAFYATFDGEDKKRGMIIESARHR